jgi:hypothetical protein
MAIGGPEASADAALGPAAQRRTAKAGLSWSARNARMRRGRKFRSAVAAEAIEASAVLRPDQAIRGGMGAPKGTDLGHKWRLSEPVIKRRQRQLAVSAAEARERDAVAPPLGPARGLPRLYSRRRSVVRDVRGTARPKRVLSSSVSAARRRAAATARRETFRPDEALSGPAPPDLPAGDWTAAPLHPHFGGALRRARTTA